MTLFKLTHKTLIYYLIPCLFWNILFWCLYDIRTLCFYLDVICAFNLRYILQAFICVIIYYFAFKSAFNMYGVCVNFKRVKSHLDEILEHKYSIGYDGEQDSGKTFSMTYDGIYLAPFKYDNLLFSYYLDLPNVDELKEEKDQFRFRLFKAREESVEFYDVHEDKIPCYYSNYEVIQHFRQNYKLKREHFIMERRLPESAVGCGDEFANMFGNELRRKANDKEDDKNVNEANQFASLHRQYADFTFLSNDQRLGEIFNGFRTCMGVRRHLETKEERYTPNLLVKIRESVRKKIMKLGKNNTKKLSARYRFWDNLCCRIGFLKIGYTKETGIVGNEKKDKELQYYSLGKDIDFSYKHRGEFVNYPALGKKF